MNHNSWLFVDSRCDAWNKQDQFIQVERQEQLVGKADITKQDL